MLDDGYLMAYADPCFTHPLMFYRLMVNHTSIGPAVVVELYLWKNIITA